MSKVAITKDLLDDLADAVSEKTGESTPLTIEDMTDAIEAITLRTGTDLSASGATVTVPAGLYSAQQTKTVDSGSATTPRTTITVTPSITFNTTYGVIESTVNASQSVTPTISAGYVSSGTAGTVSVTGANSYSFAMQDAQTIHPSTSDQTIASGKYLTGTQTIKGVALSNLTAGNIKKDVVVKVGDSTDDDCVTSVTGTYEGGTPTLQTKSVSYTPSTSQQTATVTADNGYDGLEEVNVTVDAISPVRTSSDLTASGATVTAPAGYYASNATKTIPNAEFYTGKASEYFTDSGVRKWRFKGYTEVDLSEGDSAGYIGEGHWDSDWEVFSAVPANTTITPSTSAQTIGDVNYMLEGAVTVAAMPSGTAGTPTATKGAVSNHSVSVTPSVTNQTGYITGSTKTGTAVSVSASELVSGTLSVTSNGQQDVTNYQYIDVSVSGGGGSSIQTDQVETELSSVSSSITFTGLQGEPTSFICYFDGGDLATGTPSKVAAIVFDGTSLHGQTITNTSNAQVSYDGSSFSKSYSNGSLTITSTGASFQADYYVLDYTYDGTAGNIQTADVQVGSGATSITFTDLEDEPIWWSCIFKSNFSTSSGYQRVIWTRDNGSNLTGMSMDSAAHGQSSWTSSYSNGSLTITSQGTNQGGYFHQPGYYQLTYAIASASPYEKVTKTYTPTTSQQTDTITPSTGYDAIDRVNVTIEAVPTMTLPSASSSTSSGTSKATITPTSSAQYLNIPVGYNGTAQYYTIAASGGGGGSASIDTKTVTASNRPSSLSFTSMKGQPIAWFLKATFTMTSSSSTYYYVDSMRFDGTGVEGRLFQMGSTRQTMNVTTGYSASYSGTTLTISSTGNRTTSPGCFYNGSYELVYVY